MRLYKTQRLLLFILLTSVNYLWAQNNSLKKLIEKIPADTVLAIKSYDGKNEVVHPDVILKQDSSGKPIFYLAFTPYPYYNDKFENPCLHYSYDGLNFKRLDSLTDPIVPTPSRRHNDDPDILFDEHTQEFLMYYLETVNPDSQNVKLLTSKDAVYWNNKTAIHYNLQNKEPFMVSPSIVKKSKKSFLMFYVNYFQNDTITNQIELIQSKNKLAWNKNKRTKITINGIDPKLSPWHIDVVKHTDGYYYMLLDAERTGFNWFDEKQIPDYELLLIRSKNLKDWQISTTNVNSCRGGNAKDCSYIYRSSSLFVEDYLLVYYSYFTIYRQCFIGVKKIKVSDLKF